MRLKIYKYIFSHILSLKVQSFHCFFVSLFSFLYFSELYERKKSKEKLYFTVYILPYQQCKHYVTISSRIKVVHVVRI